MYVVPSCCRGPANHGVFAFGGGTGRRDLRLHREPVHAERALHSQLLPRGSIDASGHIQILATLESTHRLVGVFLIAVELMCRSEPSLYERYLRAGPFASEHDAPLGNRHLRRQVGVVVAGSSGCRGSAHEGRGERHGEHGGGRGGSSGRASHAHIIGHRGGEVEQRGTLAAVTSTTTSSRAWPSWFDRDRAAKIVDPHFDRVFERQAAPGIAYGVVLNGRLVHSRGLGASMVGEGEDAAVPNPHTAFRIASMTKSFSAATVLSLRDEGALHLETPAADLVPEVGSSGHPWARQVTVRHLLTMGAGYLTDDPWGDRQQDLPIDTFRNLLAGGVRPALPPGDRFEYSNLGYALLGLVISAVSGQSYVDAVTKRVLEPVGLHETGFTTEVAAASLAKGYVRRLDGWVEEPIAAPGAFSPMGGLISTVSDLARWVGFLESQGTRSEGVVPLSELSVREMQRTQRLVTASVARDAAEAPDVIGYGCGLFEEFRPWGRSVSHSGGYPGFGSHMRWHPASGLGLVALANGTYAPMSTVSLAAMADLVRELGAPITPDGIALPGLDAAVKAVQAWLAAADPDGAEAVRLRSLWADNVERDLPWAERLAALAALRAECGPLSPVAGSEKRHSPGSLTWDMTGQDAAGAAEARVRVTVMVAPHDPDLVQSVTLRRLKTDEPPAALTADVH